MYPTEFAYAAPATLAEAVQLLQQGNGEAKLLAGGQSLIPLLKLRLAEPGALVDLRRIPELQGIREEGDAVVLGAMTTYFQALESSVLGRRVPLLLEAIQQVGDMQVRARGTVGGSLAHADPAGDLPAVALALDAILTAVGPSGTRMIAARDFFVEMLATALKPDEVLTQVRFPAIDTPRTGSAYVKHRQPASGYAVVGVAAVVGFDTDGFCRSARVAITGVGTKATRAMAVEQALGGKRLAEEDLAQAATFAADGLDLMSDTYASADFRAHLARVLTRRALAAAVQQARSR
ncbi:MAG TPA: xanthine dehydrogenase family protein subunit M [Ktedonobacterales bacterium]